MTWLTVPADFGTTVSGLVSDFTSALGNLIPELMMYGLPILIIIIFWNKIWGYLKRVFKVR